MHARHAHQQKLFDLSKSLPNGLVYRPDFLTAQEEEVLTAYIQNLPLERAVYKDLYFAKRRYIGFGWSYDYRNERLIPGPPLPSFLQPLQKKIAKWLGVPSALVVEALVNEYSEGAGIGWHRDNEQFDTIIGISLGGWCRMQFRPLFKQGSRRDPKDIVALEIEPRSAYIMQSQVRWHWQHSVVPVQALRYSITFRTLPKTNRRA